MNLLFKKTPKIERILRKDKNIWLRKRGNRPSSLHMKQSLHERQENFWESEDNKLFALDLLKVDIIANLAL